MRNRISILVAAALSLCVPKAESNQPANIVTSASDSGAGSLRATVASATPGSTVTFSAALAGQSIALSSGPIILATNITVDGSALTNMVQINGGSNSCVFVVSNGATAALNSLVITNGYDGSGNLAGGIWNGGDLTLSNCVISGNAATSDGG